MGSDSYDISRQSNPKSGNSFFSSRFLEAVIEARVGQLSFSVYLLVLKLSFHVIEG